jgi:hypothetical protein
LYEEKNGKRFMPVVCSAVDIWADFGGVYDAAGQGPGKYDKEE